MHESCHHSTEPSASAPRTNAIIWTLLGVIVALAAANQYFIARAAGPAGAATPAAAAATATAATAPSGDPVSLAIATGVPAVYGQELNVSYDAVEASMTALGAYDPDYGSKALALTPEQQQRYVAIGSRISCEYCCGARAIVAPNGKAACGCAHSQAMRGLANYLLARHGTEVNDDQILRELARWKARFFPKQMIAKVSSQRASGQYTTDVAALLLGAPASAGPSSGAPLPSSIQNLPNMVGGC